MANKSDKKYRIDEQVARLPRVITINDLLTELKQHDINSSTFYRDRDIKLGDKQSIPSDRLDAYAVIFGCTTDDLKNYEVKGQSIHNLLSKSKRLKTGLKQSTK